MAEIRLEGEMVREFCHDTVDQNIAGRGGDGAGSEGAGKGSEVC
jgi:hypothetical protein